MVRVVLMAGALLGLVTTSAVMASPIEAPQSLNVSTDGIPPHIQCVPSFCGLAGCFFTSACSLTISNCAEGFGCPGDFQCDPGLCGQATCRNRPECTESVEVCNAKDCGLPSCFFTSACSLTVSNCAEGFGCPQDFQCDLSLCGQATCRNRPECTKSLEVCNEKDCGLPSCFFTPACSLTVSNCGEGFHCPPDLKCDPSLCAQPACRNRPECAVAKRQFGCPPGLPCGHGPVCTKDTCDLPGCANAEVCLKKRSEEWNGNNWGHPPSADEATVKRNDPHRRVRPCHHICDDRGRCGCDFEAAHGPVKRAGIPVRPCPLICDQNGHCACDPSPSHTIVSDAPVATPTGPSCPLVCYEDGHCECDPSPPHTIVTGAPVVTPTHVAPCPLICKADGECVCHPTPVHGPFPTASA